MTLGIEVTWDVGNGEEGVRSHFFARVYVANNKVAKSNLQPRSAVIKWKWNPGKKLHVLFAYYPYDYWLMFLQLAGLHHHQ